MASTAAPTSLLTFGLWAETLLTLEKFNRQVLVAPGVLVDIIAGLASERCIGKMEEE